MDSEVVDARLDLTDEDINKVLNYITNTDEINTKIDINNLCTLLALYKKMIFALREDTIVLKLEIKKLKEKSIWN